MARRGRSMFQGMGATMIAMRKMMKKAGEKDRELARLRSQVKKAKKGGHVRKARRGGRMRGGFHA